MKITRKAEGALPAKNRGGRPPINPGANVGLNLTVRLSTQMDLDLTALSEKIGKSRGQLIREAIDEKLRRARLASRPHGASEVPA